ncbi:glycosyltransferase [Lacticaseibacillus mingshuiensis]|uniref:glycosyltransferase n=1 Tax=Lacticaseibacillus mingshuiensis TaxID=2799574 RepID=UPI001950F08D|nr:glycosyltransferase [Lacticaseibacillus mingshuiensis]
MHYFIGSGVSTRKSGVEQAQLLRLALFRKQGMPSCIVTLDQSINAHALMTARGAQPGEFMTLMDWYQHSTTIGQTSCTPDMVAPHGSVPQFGGREGDVEAANFLKNGQVLVQVRSRVSDHQVSQVLWPDAQGRVRRVDSYDSRGFLSRQSQLESNGHLSGDRFLDVAGHVAVTILYNGDIDHGITQITLADGRHYSDQAHFEYAFLQELDAAEPSVFYFDRGYDSYMTHDLSLRGQRVVVVHNDHEDYEKENAAAYTKVYQQLGIPVTERAHQSGYATSLADPGLIDAFLVSTPQQQAMIQRDYPQTAPVLVAPVGVMLEPPRRVAFDDRERLALVVASRISPEKGLDDLIKAFEMIHGRLPLATLTIYGAGGGAVADNYLRLLKQHVLAAGLEEAVNFLGFRVQAATTFDKYGLYLMTSRTEAFNIGIQEALSHGLPVISYDVPYGPQALIQNGQNGLLTPPNEPRQLAQAALRVLETPTLQANMSLSAYRSRDRYNSDAVWQQYQALFELMK